MSIAEVGFSTLGIILVGLAAVGLITVVAVSSLLQHRRQLNS